jgi:hypothetical protein
MRENAEDASLFVIRHRQPARMAPGIHGRPEHHPPGDVMFPVDRQATLIRPFTAGLRAFRCIAHEFSFQRL